MFWSNMRVIGLMVVIAGIMTACGAWSSSVISMGADTITLSDTYEKIYTTTPTTYKHRDGKTTQGTMIVEETDHQRTTDEMDAFMYESSYPWYAVNTIRTIISECEREYRRYHVSFVANPIDDTMMYLSYIFTYDKPTVIISYLTTSKKHRSVWERDWKKAFGCSS